MCGDVFLTLRNMITFKSVFKKLSDAFSGPIVIMEVVLYISLNCSAIICWMEIWLFIIEDDTFSAKAHWWDEKIRQSRATPSGVAMFERRMTRRSPVRLRGAQIDASATLVKTSLTSSLISISFFNAKVYWGNAKSKHSSPTLKSIGAMFVPLLWFPHE